VSALLLALALAAPHPTLKVYFQAQLDDAKYQQAAFDKVARSFTPPGTKPALGKKTVVQAIIARDGKLISTTVGMTSGAKTWDDAALGAVKRAGPFAPLPASFPASSVEVHFHLSWEG
jgi:protein TonB